MRKITAARPSAGMIVAVVALCLALVGSAAAGTGSLRAKLGPAQVKSIARKQANRVVNSRTRDFVLANALFAQGSANPADLDNFTATAYTTVLTEGFSAPEGGFAVINSAVGAVDDPSLAGASALYSRVSVDGTPTTNDNFNSPAFYSAPGDGGTGTNTVVVPVGPGQHNAELQIRVEGSGALVLSRQLTVVVVPRGKGTPVPFSATGG